MLTVLRDLQGRLDVACEWWLVDDTGMKNHLGKYVWVENLEGSSGCGVRVMRQLIQRIAAEVPQAVGAYWIRRHKTWEWSHGFRRDQLLREGVGV